ncbi:MAG: sigma-70 family RNA polymerase sigma factor [Actinomyces sp.]|nr:MAG: sigma-70 family RNA polymerase sigma factor [Actinomyces sp.]
MNDVRRLRLLSSPLDSDEPPVPATDPVDAALLRSGRGDEAAFAEVYDLTAATVFGVVKGIVRDPAMAEEVAQAVFVEIWRLAPRFDPARGSARSWIHTVAHRRAVDCVRSEQSRRNREEADGRRAVAAYDAVAESVERDLDRERVHAALARLSDKQREALELAYFGGHTYREVAVLLGVAEGTVKTRIRDGMIKLRDQLGVIS